MEYIETTDCCAATYEDLSASPEPAYETVSYVEPTAGYAAPTAPYAGPNLEVAPPASYPAQPLVETAMPAEPANNPMPTLNILPDYGPGSHPQADPAHAVGEITIMSDPGPETSPAAAAQGGWQPGTPLLITSDTPAPMLSEPNPELDRALDEAWAARPSAAFESEPIWGSLAALQMTTPSSGAEAQPGAVSSPVILPTTADLARPAAVSSATYGLGSAWL